MDDRQRMLEQHIERFNTAVRSGDFSSMLAHFAPDAVLAFEGVHVGPFSGRDAIAAAYAAQPPDDTVSIENTRIVGDEVVCDYTWSRDQPRSGEMRLTTDGDQINRLTVSFDQAPWRIANQS
jgi:steroid Delta-isomerase